MLLDVLPRGAVFSNVHQVAQLSKTLHLSARGVTTDNLVRIQTVSQLAVIVSLIGRSIIGPASSEFGRCRPS